MAVQRSPRRAKKDEQGQGTATEDRGVVVPLEQRVPYDPENIRLSKKAFIEKQQAKKEKAQKMAEYSKQLDEEKKAKKEEKKDTKKS